DRVLQLLLPVDLDGVADVALVVGAGVLVDLDDDDTGSVEVRLDPVGIHQCGGAAHVILPYRVAAGSRRRMMCGAQPGRTPRAAARKAATGAGAPVPEAPRPLPTAARAT